MKGKSVIKQILQQIEQLQNLRMHETLMEKVASMVNWNIVSRGNPE